MINEVRNFLNEYGIKNKKVIVGFSSGPDSCALAYILSLLKDEYKLKLVLGYFNHNWRVEESKIEQQYASEFASKINAEFYSEVASMDNKKTEEVARELRYDFFKNCMKKFDTDVVFLAHNLDDNIETLIYRTIKGTSIKGLASILPHRDNYYRPLLNISKKEILDFLKKNNIEYKFDSSNDDVKYKRNYIRKVILPTFEKLNPNYKKNIQTLIHNSINANKIIEDTIEKIKKDILSENKINRKKYIELDKEYRYELINNLFGSELKYRNHKNIVKIDDFIINNDNSKMSLNKNKFIIVNDYIFIEEKVELKDESILINSCGKYNFENLTIEIKEVNKNDKIFPKSNEPYCYLNFDFPITIRHRKNGDLFSPLGLKNGKMKLKEYFINEKFSLSQKNSFILLCKDNIVCSILGIRISEKFKVKNNNCYKITWRENG